MMDEQEWLTCADPTPMFQHLHKKVSAASCGFFAFAAAHPVFNGLIRRLPARSRRSVKVSERYADGLASEADGTRRARRRRSALSGEDLRRVRRVSKLDPSCRWHAVPCPRPQNWPPSSWRPMSRPGVPIGRTGSDPRGHAVARASWILPANTGDLPETPSVPSYRPHWLSPTVQALALAAYDNRALPAGTLDNACLAILADALEDASCTGLAILGHLRRTWASCAGCHVVDALRQRMNPGKAFGWLQDERWSRVAAACLDGL